MKETYPFQTVEDLSQFFLWPLLTRRQQTDTLTISDRAERHLYFASCLTENGYPLPKRERIAVSDLASSVAAYLATLDDTEQSRDRDGRTARESALSELTGFLRWTAGCGDKAAEVAS